MNATANPAMLAWQPGSGRTERRRRKSIDRFGDGLLYGVCALAALLAGDDDPG